MAKLRDSIVKLEPDPRQPSLPLLMKLGSIVVHADEFTEPGGHEFDLHALKTLIRDADVQVWIKAMGGLLPVKRTRK
jgi:hypothetical protein